MKFEPGKLYKLIDDTEFCPENYCDYKPGYVPIIEAEENTILLFIKKRQSPDPQVRELLAHKQEHVFLYKNKLVVPYRNSTDINPEKYFERVS